MSEEEKKAFERLKSYYLQNARGNREIQKVFEPIFDLIIKQEKEIEELKQANFEEALDKFMERDYENE